MHEVRGKALGDADGNGLINELRLRLHSSLRDSALGGRLLNTLEKTLLSDLSVDS
jgi:hypothetical protein